ncbi:MAG: hypothetical protein AAGE43_13830 [Pseudomonadota bacterium]
MKTVHTKETLALRSGYRNLAQPLLKSLQRFVLLRSSGRCRLAAVHGTGSQAIAQPQKKKKALHP